MGLPLFLRQIALNDKLEQLDKTFTAVPGNIAVYVLPNGYINPLFSPKYPLNHLEHVGVRQKQVRRITPTHSNGIKILGILCYAHLVR